MQYKYKQQVQNFIYTCNQILALTVWLRQTRRYMNEYKLLPTYMHSHGIPKNCSVLGFRVDVCRGQYIISVRMWFHVSVVHGTKELAISKLNHTCGPIL